MPRTALLAVGLLLAALVDRSTSTATGVVLPWVQGDLALSGDQAPLVTLTYNGAFYSGILLGPLLLLRFGRIRYFVYCMVAYGIASLLCATSNSLSQLVACRVLLGFAEGGFFLAGLVTIFTSLPTTVVPYFVLAYGAISQSGSAVAPVVAGAIVDTESWRMLYLALAVGALTAAALIQTSSAEGEFDVGLERQRPQMHMDFLGIALLIIAVGAYSYLTGYGAVRDWLNSSDVATAFVIFLAAGLALIFWECVGARYPVVPFRIFTHRNAWLGVALGLAIGFPLYGITELLRYLEAALNFPAGVAGAVIALRALALLIAAPIATVLIARGADSRLVIASGFGLSMLAFFWEATGVTSGATFQTFIGAELLVGVGFGLTFTPLLFTVISNTQSKDAQFAIAMMNLSFVAAGSFANAWLNTVFDHRFQKHLSDLAGSVTLSRSAIQTAVQAGGPAATHYLSALVAQQATVLAFADVAICSAAVAALAIPFALLLHKAKPLSILRSAVPKS